MRRLQACCAHGPQAGTAQRLARARGRTRAGVVAAGSHPARWVSAPAGRPAGMSFVWSGHLRTGTHARGMWPTPRVGSWRRRAPSPHGSDTMAIFLGRVQANVALHGLPASLCFCRMGMRRIQKRVLTVQCPAPPHQRGRTWPGLGRGAGNLRWHFWCSGAPRALPRATHTHTVL